LITSGACVDAPIDVGNTGGSTAVFALSAAGPDAAAIAGDAGAARDGDGAVQMPFTHDQSGDGATGRHEDPVAVAAPPS